MYNRALVSFGSNIQPLASLQRVEAILRTEQQVIDKSSFQWTEPEGIRDQPRFLNGAFLIGTNLEEGGFCAFLKQLEDRLGRTRTGPKAGPRTTDLDLLIWNSEIVHTDYWKASYIQAPLKELLDRNNLRPKPR